MTKTGIYKFNPQTGKVEKVSDRVRGVTFDSVSLPGGQPYYSEHLDCHIRSRRHKRDVLRRQGLVEVAERGAFREVVRAYE